jgi:hypothetical protein
MSQLPMSIATPALGVVWARARRVPDAGLTRSLFLDARATFSNMAGRRGTSGRILAIAACLVAPAACKRVAPELRMAPAPATDEGGPVPVGEPFRAGSAVARYFSYDLAVFYLPRPKADVRGLLIRLLQGEPIELRWQLPEGGAVAPVVGVREPPIAKFAPPSSESIGTRLTDEQKRQLAASQSVTILRFAGPGSDALATYPRALALVGELAAATGGLPWDEETREIFSVEAWEKRRRDWQGSLPDVADHIAIQAYVDGELLRMFTLGMRKLALPDLLVNEVPLSYKGHMASVIDVACQTLVERPVLGRAGELPLVLEDLKHAGARARATTNLLPNRKPRVPIQLVMERIEEGVTDNRLAEIALPGPAAELQERQVQLVADLFGSRRSDLSSP